MDDKQNIYERHAWSLLSSSQLAQAVLSPIDPRASIRIIAKKMLEAAETDENIGGKFNAIQAKLGDSKPLIGNDHSAMFERLKSPGIIPYIPTAPEFVRPVIAVAYLLAKRAIASKNASNIFKNLQSTLDEVLALVDNIDPSFIGELLIETLLTAREDRQFARTLHEGASEFRTLVNELYGPDLEDPNVRLATAAPNSSGSGSCRICRVVDGIERCEPTSCWVIVVIIVIVIVTK